MLSLEVRYSLAIALTGISLPVASETGPTEVGPARATIDMVTRYILLCTTIWYAVHPVWIHRAIKWRTMANKAVTTKKTLVASVCANATIGVRCPTVSTVTAGKM
ncbi:hypothetical protein FTZ03_11720 [Salmonella enterica]|nr:hypothetical protein [Salmonella enterica]EEJ0780926.1 hypothetical protein [Salmonella enterica]